MKKGNQVAHYFANILGNLAVVGFGLALFQQEWWCMFIAIISAKLGFLIVWRAEND